MKLFFLATIFAISFSCSTVYQPSAVMTPLLEKKGDLEAQLTFRMGDMNTDFEAFPVSGATVNTGIAYAFSGKYAGILNLEYQNEYFKNSFDNFASENKSRKGILTETYFGRYFSKPQQNNTGIFLGIGQGHRNLVFTKPDYDYSYISKYESDYLKASLLIEDTIREKWRRDNERSAISFFSRVCWNHPYNVRSSIQHHYASQYDEPSPGEYLDVQNIWTIEPGLNISLIYGRCAFFVQGMASVSPFHFFDPDDENYSNKIIVAFGTRINLKYRK